jgi:hypothetical protein
MTKRLQLAALLFAIYGCMWSCGGGGGTYAFAQKDTATRAELEKRLANIESQIQSTDDLARLKKLNAEEKIVGDRLIAMDTDRLHANTVEWERLNSEMHPQLDQAQISLNKLQAQRRIWNALCFWKWRAR